jgi:hypothetical protein
MSICRIDKQEITPKFGGGAADWCIAVVVMVCMGCGILMCLECAEKSNSHNCKSEIAAQYEQPAKAVKTRQIKNKNNG